MRIIIALIATFPILILACSSNTSDESRTNRSAPSEVSSAADHGRLGGVGVASRLRFELQFEPSSPEVGRIFSVITTVRDARSGRPISDASFTLDASMPQHGHGMTTRPQHQELGMGRYRSDGMKLHMPGPWSLTVEVNTDEVTDRFTLRYEPSLERT